MEIFLFAVAIFTSQKLMQSWRSSALHEPIPAAPQVRELHRGSGFTADGTEDLQERGTPRGLGAKHS